MWLTRVLLLLVLVLLQEEQLAARENPKRAKTASTFYGQQREPRAHLRVHGIPEAATTVLLAQGESRNGKDAEDRLPYILLRRRGENLDSTFVVAYEPYLNKPFLPDRPLIATVNREQVSVKVKGGYTFRIRNGTSVEVGKGAGRAFTLSGTSGPS